MKDAMPHYRDQHQSGDEAQPATENETMQRHDCSLVAGG